MDSVVESLLNTLENLKKKRPEIHESCRDLLRLCSRCEIFSVVLMELKNHPMMLNDLTESENELLYDLHTTVQNICTFIDDNVNRTDLKAITQLDFRLSYFTDLAQLNQKVTQLIEALNLQEQIDLDRVRDEDLEDAKESFEYIIRKVIQEISLPTNVYFDEEFDSLNQDIDNHEEALCKLLALLKHRPLSVAEAKTLKAEINKLKGLVEESRRELKDKGKTGAESDRVHSYNTRRLPELPLSVNSSPHTSAASKSTFASSSSFNAPRGINSLSNSDNLLISSFKNQQQSLQAISAYGENPFEESDVSSTPINSKIENYELNPHTLNRLLRSSEQLSDEEISFKRRVLETMIISPTDLDVTKIRVGRGTFGDVCLGTLRHRYKVAIKTLKRSSDARKDEQRKRLIEKEMLIAKYLGSYPTIPVCYGFVTMDSCIQVVLELAPYGSLSLLLKDSQSFPIVPVALKIAWLSDLADAVRFLHSKEIMHKNICADNILVFEKLRLKLSDFGPEKSKGRSEGDIKAFLAPEVREGKNPEYGSDVFSFAITALQIFSRRMPHLEKPEEQMISAIEKEWIEPKESKDSLLTLFLDSLKCDSNQHVNDVRPSSEDLFQEILSILETIGGDPREESHCNDYFVIQEIESVAKQRRNEMMRIKSSYKSNLSLRPTSSSQLQSLSSRRASLNITGSSKLLRNSFFPNQSSNGNNATSFSYSQFNKIPVETQEFLSNSIDIEDKASIAYFLIQAAKFTPLEADFMADRLVRKGVSCVSTLRRKLHRDREYLSSIGVDKDTAKRIETAIFSISSPQVGSVPVVANSPRVYASSSGASRRKEYPSNRLSGSAHSSNELEGNTDRDNDESDSLESGTGSDFAHNRSRQNLRAKKVSNNNKSVAKISAQVNSGLNTKNLMAEKAVMLPDVEGNTSYQEQLGFDDQEIALSPDESIVRIFQNSKQMMEKRNILSKFLRVEINLSPELANKYSDIMIAHNIEDLSTLQKKMMTDSKILVKYGFDKRISNTIFDHLTVQAISRFQNDHQMNDVDMTLNPSGVSTVSMPVKVASSNSMLQNYVANNCGTDIAPVDIAHLYYESSQMSNTDALERLLEVAESGDYLAQGFLMRMYVLGQGDVKQDTMVAQEMGRKLFPWLQHAIQSENSSNIVMYARYLTGVCYSHGLGVAKDEPEAIKWYIQSANQGYVGAQAYLGYCYYLGIGVEKDLVEAFNWYRISALRGHSASQCNLGLCYEYGHGIERNLLEAIKWYRASAEQGDVIAQFSLGNLYEKGKKGIEQNFSEAFKYYKMSAEKGYDQAQYSLGCCYYAGLGAEQNLEQAFYWFALSASANNAAAQCKVGFCYENGIGVEKDMQKAIEFYRLASMQQHPAAMYYLGYCYFTGIGIETNVTEAVRLYMASSSKKYAAAQNNLGFCYFNGIGVNKDLNKAIEYYTLAANQEYPAAQYNLGYCFEKGVGVAMDVQQSLTWYQKAAKNGHSRAKKSLKKLNESMNVYN